MDEDDIMYNRRDSAFINYLLQNFKGAIMIYILRFRRDRKVKNLRVVLEEAIARNKRQAEL